MGSVHLCAGAVAFHWAIFAHAAKVAVFKPVFYSKALSLKSVVQNFWQFAAAIHTSHLFGEGWLMKLSKDKLFNAHLTPNLL